MARKKCTFKWQDKSLRLNGKTKVYVKMARLNCTFKWKDKSVRLNCNCIFRRQRCTFKWQDEKVYV